MQAMVVRNKRKVKAEGQKAEGRKQKAEGRTNRERKSWLPGTRGASNEQVVSLEAGARVK
jgi:hypothetical protein